MQLTIEQAISVNSKFDFSLLESPKIAVFRSFEAFFILLRVVFEGRHAIKSGNLPQWLNFADSVFQKG